LPGERPRRRSAFGNDRGVIETRRAGPNDLKPVSEVLQPGLATADREGTGSFLETSSVSNRTFYTTFGFGVIGHMRLPGDGPDIWAMYSEPDRPASDRESPVHCPHSIASW
jgi:hypothetical protein